MFSMVIMHFPGCHMSGTIPKPMRVFKVELCTLDVRYRNWSGALIPGYHAN